jgi:hypothetical protein
MDMRDDLLAIDVGRELKTFYFFNYLMSVFDALLHDTPSGRSEPSLRPTRPAADGIRPLAGTSRPAAPRP